MSSFYSIDKHWSISFQPGVSCLTLSSLWKAAYCVTFNFQARECLWNSSVMQLQCLWRPLVVLQNVCYSSQHSYINISIQYWANTYLVILDSTETQGQNDHHDQKSDPQEYKQTFLVTLHSAGVHARSLAFFNVHRFHKQQLYRHVFRAIW